MKTIHKLCILLIVVASIPATATAQEKLILKRGVKRVKLKSGMQVIPITYEDSLSYEAWQHACKDCELRDSVWMFDSVSADGLAHFSKISSYDYSTFTAAEFRRLSKEEKLGYRTSQERDCTYLKKGRLHKVWRKAHKETRAIPLTEIESLRFAEQSNCTSASRRRLYLSAGLAAILLTPAVVVAPWYYGLTYIAVSTVPNLVIGSILAGNVVIHIETRKVHSYDLNQWRYKVK